MSMITKTLLLFCLLVATLLAGCSHNSTTATYAVTTTPAIDHRILDQRLFNVVGESELSQAPDDPNAALAAINSGADVNARNDLSDTPLLIAARNGRVNVMRVLLDKGADINAHNDRGETAIMISVGNVAVGDGDGDLEAARLLLRRSADLRVKDKNGLTILSGSALAGPGKPDAKYVVLRRELKKAGAQ